MNKIAEALESVIVITPAIRIWSGRVKVRRHEDLTTAQGLPPEALVSDGAKRVIEPKALAALESHRRGVDRYLSRVGIRKPMGFLIRPEDENEVYAELSRREQAFNEAKADLVDNYDVLCSQWEQANPGFEELLRRNRPTVVEVAQACEFNYAVYCLTQAQSQEGQRRFDALGKEVVSSLVADVTQTAASLLKDSFKVRTKVTQKAVNPVRELVQKLRGFSAFDPRLGPAADALDGVLATIRKTGPLDPAEILTVTALLREMADPDRLLSHGQLAEGGAGEDEDAQHEAPAELAAPPVIEEAEVHALPTIPVSRVIPPMSHVPAVF